MAMTAVPERMSEYVDNCIDETAKDVYGRDNRRPIHDAINYGVGMTQTMNTWCLDIGLCVQNGKLCVIYNG